MSDPRKLDQPDQRARIRLTEKVKAAG